MLEGCSTSQDHGLWLLRRPIWSKGKGVMAFRKLNREMPERVGWGATYLRYKQKVSQKKRC